MRFAAGIVIGAVVFLIMAGVLAANWIVRVFETVTRRRSGPYWTRRCSRCGRKLGTAYWTGQGGYLCSVCEEVTG